MKDKKTNLRKFLIISILGLLAINISFASAYIIIVKLGTLNLSPGEKYILNIPFVGQSKNPVICGKAIQTDGTLLEGVKVIAKYSNNNAILAENITRRDGKFCLSLPEINAPKKFNISIEYDNQTLTLASNDYQLNFVNNKIYNRNTDNTVSLSGTITNEDAQIENGRFEINLKYYDNSSLVEIFDYQKYSVNIEPNQVYSVPNSELNVSWPINGNTPIGRYKFYVKTSFNAEEKTSNIYFNVTG